MALPTSLTSYQLDDDVVVSAVRAPTTPHSSNSLLRRA
jgi:hypothetical protein